MQQQPIALGGRGALQERLAGARDALERVRAAFLAAGPSRLEVALDALEDGASTATVLVELDRLAGRRGDL
jgi:hypothetical protein